MGTITFEIAAESINSVRIIQQQHLADRIELCDNLVVGGTTPSAGLIRLSRKNTSIPIMVLIRPRPGDFLYSDAEFEVVLSDIAFAKKEGMDGIVTGILKQDGQVDRDRMIHVVEAARPMQITFHRAFDMAREPFEAIDTLVDLGIDRVLTSGQMASAWDGRGLIRQVVDYTNDLPISIMAGGGVNAQNVQDLVKATGVQEIHTSARSRVESKMIFRREQMAMARPIELNEYQWLETDPETASNMRRQLG